MSSGPRAGAGCGHGVGIAAIATRDEFLDGQGAEASE